MIDGKDIDEYAEISGSTAQYPYAGTGNNQELAYLGLGFSGEAGEVANDIKKLLRGLPGDISPDRMKRIRKELGDSAWYWARLCCAIGAKPSDILRENAEKLAKRRAAGTIGGQGDR